MKRKKIDSVLAACMLVAAGFFLPVSPVYSVHDTGIFELDGNVADPAAGLPDDWAGVVAIPGSPHPNELARTGVTPDPAPQSIFAGGGSKDDLDLNGPLSKAGGWKHKNGSIPDKDDITNAYAVAYNVGGELVIYAGADRFDNNGDAFIGFWFFQNQIGLGPISGASGPFTGQHAVGDVLVLANFTGGGTTVNIEVLQWVGSGGNVNGTLQRIAGVAGGTPARCQGTLVNDSFCGITNAGAAGETPPWAYLSKSGSASFPDATFFEVGINITRVFSAAGGGATPCFSSFMAETRSSSSVDAVLKDFALHAFPVCGIAVSKVCKNPVLASSTTIGYTIEGQVQNTGFGALTSVALSDNPPVSGFTFHACSSGLPTGAPIGFGGTLNPLQSVCYRSSFTSSTNGPSDTITASASTGSATVSATATANCPNIQLSPQLNVTKACTTTLAQVAPYLAVKVNVTGTVTNTGDTPLTNVVVTDTDIAGNLIGPISLAAGASADFIGSYFPSSAENRLNLGSSTVVPGLAKFSDMVTATGTAPFSTPVTPATFTANCTLCPTCAPDVCSSGGCPQSTGASSSTLLR